MRIAAALLLILTAGLLLAGCGGSGHVSWHGFTQNDGIGGTGGASVDVDIYDKTDVDGIYANTW